MCWWGRCCTARTGSGRVTLFHGVYDGTSWGAWRADELGWKANSHVPIAPRTDRMWRITTGADGQIHTSINGGGRWASQGTVPNWRASHAPALASDAGTLTILMRGPGANGPLWVADYNGSWYGAQTIPGATPQDAPAAAYFDHKLYAMYRRRPDTP